MFPPTAKSGWVSTLPVLFMIVCPNCSHQNPEGATQCEACYTALPSLATCPSCGQSVLSDATFCGHCGFNLNPEIAANLGEVSPAAELSLDASQIPPTIQSMPPDLDNSENLAESKASTPVAPSSPPLATTIQTQIAHFLHEQTNTILEIPQNLSVIHIGKPNEKIPPDLDVSAFPNSEIVSRVHADVRVEGGKFYIEDLGSANGTYINYTPLLPGNRHLLRPGDRIALGKEDKVTFLFQLS